jgi:hypothetical protein
MDPLTLLRELFGEEPIRKVVTSGFDSAHKIAATTPESLSFFSGLNEALARQIVASAEESLTGPPSAAYRGSLTGSVVREGEEESEKALPVKPRVPPAPKAQAAREGAAPGNPLDEEGLLLDAAGIAKTVAQEPRPKEVVSAPGFMGGPELMSDEELLEEVGLSDAEATFLEGISPWSRESPGQGKTSTAPLSFVPPELPAPAAPEKETEYAPLSNWSPETDPEPVPRIVRAAELGPDPAAPAGVTEVPEEKGFAIVEDEPAPPEPAARPLGRVSRPSAEASSSAAGAVLHRAETAAAIVEDSVAIYENSARAAEAPWTLVQGDAGLVASLSSQAQTATVNEPAAAPAGRGASQSRTVAAGSTAPAKRGAQELYAQDSFWRFGK